MNFDVKRMVRFEHNVGSKDQKIRYAVGIALLLLSVFLGNIFLLLLGVILVGSAYLTWCPILSGLGKTTLETEMASATASEAPAEPGGETVTASKESAPAADAGSQTDEATSSTEQKQSS